VIASNAPIAPRRVSRRVVGIVAGLEPITHEYVLRCDPHRAFDAYTSQIGYWWHRRYTANPDTFGSVTIEPAVGGRVYASHTDIGEDHWGEVTIWEPGSRVVHTFTLAQDPDHPSQVTAVFAPGEGGLGCVFRLEHGGWSEANGAARAKFGDWPVLLDRFVALADGRD
jgi:hypothetical protein